MRNGQVGKHTSFKADELEQNALDDPLHSLWNDSSDEHSGIFGLPFTIDDASVVIVPVPWEAACSQGTGTANAPALIMEQSRYVELHDTVLGNIYKRGIAMALPLPAIVQLADQANYLSAHDTSIVDAHTGHPLDSLCQQLNELVRDEISSHLSSGRTTAPLGGDHSISYGSIAAHLDAFPGLGILQIDAHADLRPSLDGLTWSHASVMRHVMESLRPVNLTQVGIRSICSVERAYQMSCDRLVMFTDYDIQLSIAGGQSWLAICDTIIDRLPDELYLTIDIDGLSPSCCAHTGTPVPGGLSFTQLLLLLHRLNASGRTIRGFDLVEVGNHHSDALIAAHLLYTLCGIADLRS